MPDRLGFRILLPILVLLLASLPVAAQQATLTGDAFAPAGSLALDCPASVAPLEIFTYDASINNSGNSAVQGVFLEATVTEQLAFSDLRTSLGVWTLQDDQNARLDIGTLPGNTQVDFEIDLSGVTLGEAMFELTLGTAGGQNPPDNCAIRVVNAVNIDGNIVIGENDVLTILPFTELRIIGDGNVVELNDGAVIDGEGVLVLAGPNQSIFLGQSNGAASNRMSGDVALLLTNNATLELKDSAQVDGEGVVVVAGNRPAHALSDPGHAASRGSSAAVATVQNLRIDTGAPVPVDDDDPVAASDLFITNHLEVVSGQFDLNDNNLWMVGPTNEGPLGGVHIEAGATIQGGGTFNIAIDPAALGGPPNTREDAYQITGEGNLNIACDKITDAGVVMELGEVGNGGLSFNRAGVLFFTRATMLNGSFRNEGAARTEFDRLQTITTNLEVEGPGGEVFPADGTCNGNESGVYVFAPVTVEGDLVLDDTDDPATACQVEGLSFLADALDPGDQVFSTIEGDFTANGVTGLFLDFDNPPFAFHNVAFEGDFVFDAPPTFALNAPANAFPMGNITEPYTIEVPGNRVRFSGGGDQRLAFTDDLEIASVQIEKDQTDADVEIDENAAVFRINRSLEVLRGVFITNGLLDAGGVATVVINRDDAGFGVLEAGGADRAYTSDDDDNVPRKVKYTGNVPHFTGDEIPGPPDGSAGGAEVFLPVLEVYLSDDDAVITLGKDFTIGSSDKTGGTLIVTNGILDVGSSGLRLANTLTVAIGDGHLAGPEQIGARGRLDFPTDWIPNPAPDGFGRAFRPGADGIDLLYFGTTDRTVGLEWPAAVTSVPDRRDDPDLIRNVTLQPSTGANGKAAALLSITVSLREEDDVYRINGVLDVTGGATLDLAGNVLEAGGTIFMQVIHNAPDAGLVDVLVNGALALDDLDFQTASPYLPFSEGSTTVEVFTSDRSTRLFQGTATLEGGRFIAILQGLLGAEPAFGVGLASARQTAADPSQVDFFIIQGAPDAGRLDVRTLDPTNDNLPLATLADDLDFGGGTPYLSLDPGAYNVEVSTPDNSTQVGVWRFDLGGLAGQAFTLLSSGLLGDGSFTLVGFDANGDPIRPALVTATDAEAALPTDFALHGNYPNPFNPTTTILFDLDEPAEVRLVLYDVLGRAVLTPAPQRRDAGASHRLDVDASALASGTYFYRLVARSDARTVARTGRMVLVK